MHGNFVSWFLTIFLVLLTAIVSSNHAIAAATATAATTGPPSNPTSSPAANASVADPCDLLNPIDIPDPAGDATAGSPGWADMLGVQFRQLGSFVYIRWLAAGSGLSNDDVLFANEQIFRLFFDADHDNATGQQHGGVGAELKITLGIYPGKAALHYFDAPGNWIDEIFIPIVFTEDGFSLTLPMDSIPSPNFLLYFESTGTWFDPAGPVQVALDATPPEGEVRISSANVVLESGPRLMNLPSPAAPLPLTASLLIDNVETILDPVQITYQISHPERNVIPDPESIISIDTNGNAHYNSEGYITARVSIDDCQLASDEILLATGDVYGNPLSDHVVAVFPSDYIPESSTHSFGDMMSGYPNMMKYLNLGYIVSSEMYYGFRPFKGDRQILAPLVYDHCGWPGNPLATAPCCYMNCGDGSPQYNVLVHEMGHNFSGAQGMQQLLWSDQEQIASGGFMECVASLPVIYFEEEILHNGAAYGFFPGSFEYQHSRDNRENYCASSQAGLEEFEQFIAGGHSDGVFDNDSLFDGVQVFCSFFEAFSCDYIGGENEFKHHMLRRFLNIFDDTELPGFVPEKVETYFAAAYSVAAGRDMRTQLELWGFTVDGAYYEQIEPLIASKLATQKVLFGDSFEGEGDCDIGSGTWAPGARDCTTGDCSDGRWHSWDGRTWCRALITQEFENWNVTVPPGATTFDFWADWGAWDLADCGDGITSISIPVCGLNQTIHRDGVEQHLSCDVTGQNSIVIEKEAVPCEYVIIGNPYFY
jgi:hypothetical protein